MVARARMCWGQGYRHAGGTGPFENGTPTFVDTDTDADSDADTDSDTDSDTDTDTDADTSPPDPCADDPVTSFVTRDGADLVLDGDVFRFLSVNVPNLHVLEDPTWHLPDPWEQLDAVCAVQQMGGRVVRTYVLSVGDSPSEDLPRHVPAPGVFTEELFVALDQALATAGGRSRWPSPAGEWRRPPRARPSPVPR